MRFSEAPMQAPIPTLKYRQSLSLLIVVLRLAIPCDHVCKRNEGLSRVEGEPIGTCRNWCDANAVESICDGCDMICFLLDDVFVLGRNELTSAITLMVSRNPLAKPALVQSESVKFWQPRVKKLNSRCSRQRPNCKTWMSKSRPSARVDRGAAERKGRRHKLVVKTSENCIVGICCLCFVERESVLVD